MSIVSRPFRALSTASLLVAMLLVSMPSPAAALTPPRPLPHYHPPFVTQTDERPMNDCLWASAAMLLAKWTNGKLHPSHQRLRALSGDRYRGSNFDDLKIAYRKLGMKLRYSPDGGTRISFNGLLHRLAHGAGAVVLGDYSKLPRWYGRWDYGFWKMTKKEKRKHPDRDNHAVYVERFDRRHGRVWIMDPLARGRWHGEWISIWALRRFAWSSGGALAVAVTPTAKPAPFARVKTSAATLSRTSNLLQAQWSFRAPRRWHFPGVTTRTTFGVATDPLVSLARASRQAKPVADGNRPTHTIVSAARRGLTVRVPLPAKPGAYLGGIRLTDRRFGRTVAQLGGVPVFVPGPRHATLALDAGGDAFTVADKALAISVSVENSGDLTWAETPVDASDPDAKARNTRLVARWIPIAVDASQPAPADPDGGVVGLVPPPTVLEAVPLDAGRHIVVDASIPAPWALGKWALAIDVVDDIDGSYARIGSEPAIVRLEVAPPRGRAAVD